MNYYIFKDQIFTLFLSSAHLTSLGLDSKVVDYVGAKKSEVIIHELNKKRNLIFETKKSEFKSNFIIFLRDKKYHLNLIGSNDLSTPDVQIRTAKSCQNLKKITETKNYSLYQCPRSLLFINKKKISVNVSGNWISNKAFISKGPPVILNKKVIYFRGNLIK